MPALANIGGNNGDATPVAYVFSPDGPDKNGVFWFTQTTPTPVNILGAARVSAFLSPRKPGKQLTGVQTVEMRLWIPELETVGTSDSGIPALQTEAYTCAAHVTYFLPLRSTKQQRKNLRTLCSNLLNTSQAIAMIEDVSNFY